MEEKPPEYLTVKEVSRILRKSITNIRVWIDEGEMPATILPHGSKLIPKDQFYAWLKKHTHGIKRKLLF